MTSREQTVVYLCTLAAIVLIVLGSMLIATWNGGVLIGKLEAFGLGTVLGGLIGVLRIPSARTPVASTDSGDVNVEAKP
ncbi:hypothetical protein [Sphingobium sp. WCS2017Hpa-17]|uniref:hypothetical protein n=1 Tax=Sphingobium sp. WCS2017Hpa-17 TaxID=3073638 RepID=UPI00288A3BF6|nr:hypothetical protein [Sphingobium sp. WCS2017Hpa-17]